ncbi:hypothetical protein H0I76_13390 [Limibaculum sp. M0105]|uniref:Lipoprotein n=1 Tax=Thermohalobaculum xanthum TaxID=2753746 RepID=A0A8J7SFK5_9RHOB|nr:hypothetical protein [Thermohalobaculum xanthum]MBK0400186.1 hypothetical protein [Thermohalobaculum xanthum]
MKPTAALLVLGLGVLAGCASDGDRAGGGANEATAGAAGATGAATEDTAGGTATGGAGSAVPRPGSSLPTPQSGAQANPGGLQRPVDSDDVRDIYLAFEGSPGSTISVVFAIDRNADGTATGEPALRLSPENGECNPQEMRSYNFAPDSTPVFGIAQARRGVTPTELPRYLAASVTEAMLSRGLAATQEETLPQNVCTRKLWEALVAAQRARVEAAGQG